MTKETLPNVIIDKNSTYGKKAAPVITSQGTPEHNKDPSLTMSPHDKAEQFIAEAEAFHENGGPTFVYLDIHEEVHDTFPPRFLEHEVVSFRFR